eukprot:comp17801_c0_seq1/m.17873 comp17801_c0_seq1/g.17873  ORF comp17801_c0_seq1/g.17873 comp17801_c0_seq1/m.17873 type:complete len:590 (-) comp17801_c0_seq1:209-1978(-)
MVETEERNGDVGPSISEQLAHLKSLAAEFNLAAEALEKEILEQERHLQAERATLEEEKRRVRALASGREDEPIDLDVGGVKYRTTRQTICSINGTFLEALFTGENPPNVDQTGCVFIDRDGALFRYILSYLRDHDDTGFPASATKKRLLLKEAEYFGIEPLARSLRLALGLPHVNIQAGPPVDVPAGLRAPQIGRKGNELHALHSAPVSSQQQPQQQHIPRQGPRTLATTASQPRIGANGIPGISPTPVSGLGSTPPTPASTTTPLSQSQSPGVPGILSGAAKGNPQVPPRKISAGMFNWGPVMESDGAEISGGPLTQGSPVGYPLQGRDYTKVAATARKIGTAGSRDGQFEYPYGITTHGGLLYVADCDNQRVAVLRPDGGWVSGVVVGSVPLGVAVASDGTTYVSCYDDTVRAFSGAGSLIRQFGSKGSGPGQLHCPRGLAVDKMGNIYVADNHNDRVQVLSPEGACLRQYAVGARPWGVAFNSRGNLIVSLLSEHRVVEVDHLSGNVHRSFGSPGNLGTPTGVAVDSRDNVIVVESENQRVSVFGPDSAPIAVLGVDVVGKPHAVAVDAEDRVYVTDTDLNGVVIF